MQYLIMTLVTITALSGTIQSINSTITARFNPENIVSVIETKSIVKDERAQKIDAYFEARSMPLAGYGDKFIKESDRCGLDWRLLPAIGVRESSGGKRMMNNNPFGWGSAKIYFKDFNEAIEVVATNLCGDNPKTARYYKDTDTMKKLHWYNGTVIPSYPSEVVFIMKMFEDTSV